MNKYNLFQERFYFKFYSSFESLAYDLLDYCYENDIDKAKKIIHMISNIFQTSCSEFVKKDFEIPRNSVKNKERNHEYLKKFITHKCFQEEVKNKWRGDSIHLSTLQYVGYLSVCLILFPLLYFPFVIFNVSIIFNY